MSPESLATILRALSSDVAADPFDKEKAEISTLFHQSQAGNFSREQNAAGVVWPRRKYDYPWLILRKTLRMMKAASVKGASGNVNQVTHRRLVMGISGGEVPYAKFQQRGTIKLPPRQYLYLRRADRLPMRGPLRQRLRVILLNRRRQHRG